MTRTAIAAAVLLAGAGAAHGQGMPYVHEKGVCVTNCPDVNSLVDRLAKDYPMNKPISTGPNHIPIVTIGLDLGGVITKYETRWKGIAAQGNEVRIVGPCQSACTLVTAFVPKDKVCFGEAAHLAFHQATNQETGRPAPHATQWMYDRYPLEIQAWIEGKGGIEEMPYSSTVFWTLLAKTLWRMGYRRCE